MTESDFSRPENIVQLGYEPYRIDILVDLEGVEFEECYDRKEAREFDKTIINFLSLEDLIVAKQKAGRLQDLADAEQLEKLAKKKKKK